MSIEKLLEDFNSYAESSKNKLEGLLELISGGRVPSREDRQEFDAVIEALCEKYEKMRELAEQELQAEELPTEGGSFYEYFDAVKNGKAARIKTQLDEMRGVLEEFISVQSLIENLALALDPFQKDAERLLSSINSGEVGSVEEIKDEIEGPKLFMRALACEDLSSDEGNDLLDSLEENYHFPSKVTRGLSGKKYYLPERPKAEEALPLSCFVGSEKEETSSPKAVETITINDDVNEEKVTSNEDEGAPKTEEMVALQYMKEIEEVEAEEYKETVFVVALKEAGVVLDQNMFGLLSSDISSAETKKLSASVFSSDIRKGNLKAIKNIIQQIDTLNVISKELLVERFNMPSDIAEGSLTFLQRKGYLRKYRVIPGGEFYCMSPRLEKALAYKDASKFVGVKQYKAGEAGEWIEEKASSALTRAAMLTLYITKTKMQNRSGVVLRHTKQSILSEAFIFISFDGDTTGACDMFIGVFWTSFDECDDFLKMLEGFVDNDEEISRIIVVALNKEVASTFLKVLEGVGYDRLKTSHVYIYTFNDDKFIDYVDDKFVDAEEIWPTAPIDNDSDIVTDEEKDGGSDNPGEDSTGTSEIFLCDSGDGKLSMTSPIQLKEITLEKTDQTAEEKIYHFFLKKKFYCASAYAKAISLKDSTYNSIYDLIAYALNDPMKHCTYAADSVFDLISDRHNDFFDALMISVGIRTFFSNQVRYDYNIKALYDALKTYPVLDEYPSLSSVLYKLVEFKDEQKSGIDAYADYHAKSFAQLDEEIRQVQNEAKVFYESMVLGKKSEKASQRRFLETKKALLSASGEIGQYIKTVADNDIEMQPLVVDYLQGNFIKEGNTLSEDNIDFDMLWEYIMVFWNAAGERMSYSIKADLMSHLRSNIINVVLKSLKILIKWCNLIELAGNRTEDAGTAAYKKVRTPLLTDIKDAIASISTDLSGIELIPEKMAGLEAILFTLDEVLRCIIGTYEESEKRYYYVPFLSTEDVLLDDNYLPELEMRSTDVLQLQPEFRIMKHSERPSTSLTSRLKEILDDGGDDYGSARLIVDYLKETSPNYSAGDYEHIINSGEEYARETAELKKMQFIGDLELAYVSGQIDNSNSAEDKKEKILQIIDGWYEWACTSSNYGFFARVMDGYLEEIRRESKSREKDLLAQLETLKSTTIVGVGTEAKEKKVAKIQKAISEQNYTVAEDLLAHASQPEVNHEDIIEEHFLRDFLDNYEDYYKPVAKSLPSFATLVNNRTRNKEERGGKRLADNWLPGGSNLGKERLVKLLAGFGFNVDANSVQSQTAIGRFENYSVKTIPAHDGKRENYSHPIAAFGSGASQEGFRVVCLNGKYDAAGLIDVMKQIGNAKHTMILLDCALDKPERRILARKSKTELGDKLFVVVDRTVMMYMVKNFDETKVTRMLMSLIVPFGYYQPYVWESSNVMPPEIFMGRKHELESIESPTGANIVYGGRQLGKSALLKKAKADIDRDENGNRAVLVDIKHLDYKMAAKKIGHALYDEGVLPEDLETTDWEDLSRAIRKRLLEEKDRIQYLLLLLDESDAFIESCEEVNYRPFDALKEIQGIGSGRFKFVIAGLRNIVRFKRDIALGNNSVLTHLEAMTVKPFRTNEARELMEIPLHYLGLECPKENESLITLILASTNYFPGLIQMYCAKLLSAMRNKDYAGYDESDTPIYEMSEEHIKKVLADPEFMGQIKEKFFITLKLDEDNYYYLIALIMAYLYHNNGYNDGYSAGDIKDAGKTLGIAKISRLDDDKLSAFMEELKELNVLRSTDNSRYLFTRFSFFQMMGTSTEVDDELVGYMED